MLSGFGAAVLLCSTKALALLEASRPGFWGHAEPRTAVGGKEIAYNAAGDARRFQCSMPDPVALAILEESLVMLLEIGTKRIEAHVRTWVSSISADLGGAGYCVQGHTGNEVSPIVTVRHPSIPSTGLIGALGSRGIRCSERRGVVRLALHFFNTKDDIALLGEVLKEVAAR